MIHTAARLILSVLAAATLVSVVAAGPASAQGWDYGNRMRGSLFPPGQAAKNGPQTTHYQFRWFQDYGAGASQPRRSRTISGPGVQKGLSLSDEQ
jgi:hypothetical protein